jgi:hypothetical protein
MPQPEEDISAVAKEAAKLCRNVEALEKSVAKLAARINEHNKAPATYRGMTIAKKELASIRVPYSVKKPETTLEQILNLLRQADKRLRGAEIDIGNVRSQLDQISNDSWSRDDLKKHLDRKKP